MDPSAIKAERRNSIEALAAFQIPEAHLRLRTVVVVTGLSASTIRRKVAAGDFPGPVRHSTRCTRWVAGEVAAWLRQKSN